MLNNRESTLQPSSKQNYIRAYVYLIIATLCWGANTVFGRLSVGEVSPMLVVTTRWFGVVVLLALLAHRQIKRDYQKLKPHWRYICLMGASGYAIFNGLYYVAAQTTSAINMGIIQGAIPIFVLLGVLLVYQTAMTRLQVLGISITLMGVATVTAQGELQRILSLSFSYGDLLMLIACVLYAAYAIGLKRRPKVSSLSLFAAMAGVAFVVSLPLATIELWMDYSQLPSVKGWQIIALITLLPSFLAQMLFIRGVEMIGPARAGVFVNLVPVFSAILAILILGEAFQLYHGIALAMVLLGIAVSELSNARDEE